MYEINQSNQQIGGFIRRCDGLTFATVRGAGHMVPTDFQIFEIVYHR